MFAFCSILLSIIVIAYAGYKLDILVSRRDVDILKAVLEDAIDDDYIFDAQ